MGTVSRFLATRSQLAELRKRRAKFSNKPVPALVPEIAEPVGEHVEGQFDSEYDGEKGVERVQKAPGAVERAVVVGKAGDELHLHHVGGEVLPRGGCRFAKAGQQIVFISKLGWTVTGFEIMAASDRDDKGCEEVLERVRVENANELTFDPDEQAPRLLALPGRFVLWCQRSDDLLALLVRACLEIIFAS